MFDKKPIEPVQDPRPVFTVRIVYKSGYVQDFKVYSFKIMDSRYEWETANPKVRPILMGVDEIAAVWQVDAKL